MAGWITAALFEKLNVAVNKDKHSPGEAQKPCLLSLHAPTAIVYRKQWAPLNPPVELPPHLHKLSDFNSSRVITCTTSPLLSLQHCHGDMTFPVIPWPHHGDCALDWASHKRRRRRRTAAAALIPVAAAAAATAAAAAMGAGNLRASGVYAIFIGGEGAGGAGAEGLGGRGGGEKGGVWRGCRWYLTRELARDG